MLFRSKRGIVDAHLRIDQDDLCQLAAVRCGDVQQQRGLVFFEKFDGFLPVADGLILAAESVIGGAKRRVESADLIEAVKTADVLVPTVTDKIDAPLLAQAGAAPHDVTAVVAGMGPGPFTGLRVGIAAAYAFAAARDLPVLPLAWPLAAAVTEPPGELI